MTEYDKPLTPQEIRAVKDENIDFSPVSLYELVFKARRRRISVEALDLHFAETATPTSTPRQA